MSSVLPATRFRELTRHSGRAGLSVNAVKDSVVDLARDPAIVVADRNSGEFHYSSEPRKFVADNPSQRCVPVRAVWTAILASLMVACAAVPVFAGGGNRPRVIEVSNGDDSFSGKLIAKTSDSVCLMDEFGCLKHLHLSSLKSFRVVASEYNGASTAAFRQKLLKEIPTGYEVATSAHYVVAGTKGRADAYAELFEEIYRQVDTFYSVRGFDTTRPEVPLIAIVFGTQEEFQKYCEKDAMPWSKDLRGYYSLNTNRVALYDDASLLKRPRTASMEETIVAADRTAGNRTALSKALASVSGQTADTIIHETTHQVGFNIGIHRRIGQTPTWVLEGLATVLEPPGLRTRGKAGSKSGNSTINAERMNWFNTEYEGRRQPGDLAKLIATDDMFKNQTLDAYSLSWAFTWFMTENPARARKFVDYLQTLAERDPLEDYTPEQRLKDFQKAFGDIAKLEVEFIRSLDRVDANTK